MARDRASRPEAKPLRLFIAVDIPEDVRSQLDKAVAPLRERFPKARWVPPENWHVTLKFLGSTYPRLLPFVEEQLALVAARQGSFETLLTELGSFPSSRTARVLWAGLEDVERRLAGIAGELEDAFSAEFKPETREFTPHLTIARSKPSLKLSAGDLDVSLRERRFLVEGLFLYRSHLRRPAPLYEPVFSRNFSEGGFHGDA